MPFNKTNQWKPLSDGKLRIISASQCQFMDINKLKRCPYKINKTNYYNCAECGILICGFHYKYQYLGHKVCNQCYVTLQECRSHNSTLRSVKLISKRHHNDMLRNNQSSSYQRDVISNYRIESYRTVKFDGTNCGILVLKAILEIAGYEAEIIPNTFNTQLGINDLRDLSLSLDKGIQPEMHFNPISHNPLHIMNTRPRKSFGTLMLIAGHWIGFVQKELNNFIYLDGYGKAFVLENMINMRFYILQYLHLVNSEH